MSEWQLLLVVFAAIFAAHFVMKMLFGSVAPDCDYCHAPGARTMASGVRMCAACRSETEAGCDTGRD